MAVRDGSSLYAPRSLLEEAAGVNVSTVTTLMDWRKLGHAEELIHFVLRNQSGTENVYFIVQRSEDGSTPEYQPESVEVGPGTSKPVTYERRPDLFYKLSAHSTAPGYPSVPVSFALNVMGWCGP